MTPVSIAMAAELVVVIMIIIAAAVIVNAESIGSVLSNLWGW